MEKMIVFRHSVCVHLTNYRTQTGIQPDVVKPKRLPVETYSLLIGCKLYPSLLSLTSYPMRGKLFVLYLRMHWTWTRWSLHTAIILPRPLLWCHYYDRPLLNRNVKCFGIHTGTLETLVRLFQRVVSGWKAAGKPVLPSRDRRPEPRPWGAENFWREIFKSSLESVP